MTRIEVLSGDEIGRILEIPIGTSTFGRRSGVDFVVNGDAVSGRHLELTVSAEGSVRFKDLGSTNGTWSGSMKVQEGEWFPGSEIRLGNLSLKLLDSAESSVSSSGDAPQGLSEKARAEALGSGGGGKGKLALLGLLLIAGAAVGWTLWGQGDEGEVLESSSAGPVKESTKRLDAIDDLGYFGEGVLNSWQLGKQQLITEGLLETSGVHQSILLLPRFESDAGRLEFQLASSEIQVWPVVTWGTEDEKPVGTRVGPAFQNGTSHVEWPSAESSWFRIGLHMSGEGKVGNLSVEEADASSDPGGSMQSASAGLRWRSSGSNLDLDGLDGPMARIVGAGGTWSLTERGLAYTASNSSWLNLDFLQSPVLILTDADPVPLASNLVLDQAVGFVVRSERPIWVEFDTPTALRAVGGAGRPLEILLEAPSFGMDWGLETALTESARLERQIQRFARTGNTAALLSAVQELTQKWPLDEDLLGRAEVFRAEAIQNGRAELKRLERAVAEAMFLAAAEEMERVAAEAEALAMSLPGTNVAHEATQMIKILEVEAQRVLEASFQARAEYRRRLLGALQEPYPILSNWLGELDS